MTTHALRPVAAPLARILVAIVLVVSGFASQAGTALGASTFRFAVHANGDFVAQTNFVQCVGASMQMMLNMIETKDDRSSKTQLRLQNLARDWSGSRPDGRQRQGASVRGWAAGLTIEGAGPYRLAGEATIEEAMHTAAKAIATTGKPVGLLVWRGRHAWVMSGFEATADPRLTDDFEVTKVNILDPLYPYGSSAWGPSPKPGQAISLSTLGKQFVPRGMSRWSAGSNLQGVYVLVLPTPELGQWSDRVR